MDELGKLLSDNAVLIHNLLVQDAKRWEDAAKAIEANSKQACLDYARFRYDLASKIAKLKP